MSRDFPFKCAKSMHAFENYDPKHHLEYKNISVRYQGTEIKAIWGIRFQEFEIMNNLTSRPANNSQPTGHLIH